MDNTIASITHYLGRDVEALNTVSHNVANMRTPGFRAERATGDFARALPGSGMALDMRDGALEHTGRTLDVALQGNGFFTVEADGATLLMRAGQLSLDSQGLLVDPAGHAVLGLAGPIVTSGANVHIRADGTVMQGDRIVDRLQLVDVAQPQLLQEIGDGLYAYTGQTEPWSGSLRTGALEQSNVDPGSEMVHLMELTRHAQSLQHAMEAYDQVLQAGINHIGENG